MIYLKGRLLCTSLHQGPSPSRFSTLIQSWETWIKAFLGQDPISNKKSNYVIRVTLFVIWVTWFKSWKHVIQIKLTELNCKEMQYVFDSNQEICDSIYGCCGSNHNIIKIIHGYPIKVIWVMEVCDTNHTYRISFLQNVKIFLDYNFVMTWTILKIGSAWAEAKDIHMTRYCR